MGSQISTIVTGYPQVLTAYAEKSLVPKLNCLQSRGASASELTEILSKVPRIIGKRQGKSVKDIIEADKSSREYEKSCRSLPEGKRRNQNRNVLVLRDLGMPQRLLFPLLISVVQPVSGKERFEESLKKIVEMGFDYQMSDKTTEEKVNLYKKLGFSVGNVWEMFKKNPIFLALSEKNILSSFETFIGLGFSRDEFVTMAKHCPQCIGLSAESVKKKTEFLVKKKNWSLMAVVSNPAVFEYKLEKRTVPRCNVIKALMSKGLLGSELPPLSPVLAVTDEAFLKKYVRKHDDKELVAALMALFTGDRVS